jgi:hypothetical protein
VLLPFPQEVERQREEELARARRVKEEVAKQKEDARKKKARAEVRAISPCSPLALCLGCTSGVCARTLVAGRKTARSAVGVWRTRTGGVGLCVHRWVCAPVPSSLGVACRSWRLSGVGWSTRPGCGQRKTLGQPPRSGCEAALPPRPLPPPPLPPKPSLPRRTPETAPARAHARVCALRMACARCHRCVQVASLERIERELIERLRKTQLDQAAAYSELEHALGETGAADTSSAPSVTRKSG